LGGYVYAPIIAIGQLVPTKLDFGIGEYTFRFLYAIRYALVGGREPAETILQYVAIPTPLNVYTVMQPFYQDFGVTGVIVGALFYAVLYGGLYKKARSGNSLALILYAGFAVSLVTQIFAETLIMNLSGNLQFALLAALIMLISRREPCPSIS
jgi:oligosaccharide repeat unit polymerase